MRSVITNRRFILVAMNSVKVRCYELSEKMVFKNVFNFNKKALKQYKMNFWLVKNLETLTLRVS